MDLRHASCWASRESSYVGINHNHTRVDTGDEMGKRKIHGVTYYQCDCTGLPMRTSYCYAPTWKEDGRMGGVLRI